jgi:hypothetical protein
VGGRQRRGRLRVRVRRAGGQATVETLVTLGFVLFLMLTLIHLSLLSATKMMANYAAFSAGRTSMVRAAGSCSTLAGGLLSGQVAAMSVLDNLRWSSVAVPLATCTSSGGRQGVAVVYMTPFGRPIVSTDVPVIAFSASPVQPSISESGDNAK